METPRLDYACMKCLIRRNLNIEDSNISEDKKIAYLKDLISIFLDATVESSSPMIVEKINILQKKYGIYPLNFNEIKRRYNSLIQNYEKDVWKKIEESTDSLYTAISYCLIGNFIDFGANSTLSEEKAIEFIDRATNVTFDTDEYNNLKNELKASKNLVYILDNCGEIVFDKLLIKLLLKTYPAIKITVIVRGEQILNDATIEDAIQVGLDKIATVIDNGTGVAGTILDRISENCLTSINNADIILSKGMGNFETLIGCKKNIYYMFMCKCEKFAKILNVPLYSYMLKNEKRI